MWPDLPQLILVCYVIYYMICEEVICVFLVQHAMSCVTGIFCREAISTGDQFGPFEGEKVQEAHSGMDPCYVWEVSGLGVCQTCKIVYLPCPAFS